jgi:hypothetical protein
MIRLNLILAETNPKISTLKQVQLDSTILLMKEAFKTTQVNFFFSPNKKQKEDRWRICKQWLLLFYNTKFTHNHLNPNADFVLEMKTHRQILCYRPVSASDLCM